MQIQGKHIRTIVFNSPHATKDLQETLTTVNKVELGTMRPQREKIAGVKEKNELRRKMTPGHFSMGSLFFLIGSTLRLLRVSLFILCYFGNPT